MRSTFLLAITVLASLIGAAQADVVVESTVIYVVRHAEKEEGGNDPHLSPSGQQRAQRLAEMLRDAGISDIHSTPYRRTQETAAPLARALGVKVHSYDPRSPDLLIKKIRAAGGRHLVVGHSNTIGRLVEEFGGDPGMRVSSNEYDRLYIVTRMGDDASSQLLRF